VRRLWRIVTAEQVSQR